MADRSPAEPLDGHSYLVRGQQDGAPVEVRVVLDPDFLAGLGLEGVEGTWVVDATMSYLLDHQRLDELPSQFYMEDVAAAYGDFEQYLRDRLTASGGAG